MEAGSPGTRGACTSPPGRGILLALVALAAIAFGSFVLQRNVAGNLRDALIISLAWAALVSGAAILFARRRPGLTRPLLSGLALGALLGAVAFYFASVRDVVVHEDVVTAARAADAQSAAAGLGAEPPTTPAPVAAANVALAKGMFSGSDGHDGSGVATVVQTTGGERKLTFTNFDVSPGAKVEVWLTTGPEETGDRIELGGLKGNVGNQQYTVPTDADLNRYSTVILYCTPFTVRIAVAPLEAA
jgi:Electron transfer DM13